MVVTYVTQEAKRYKETVGWMLPSRWCAQATSRPRGRRHQALPASPAGLGQTREGRPAVLGRHRAAPLT